MALPCGHALCEPCFGRLPGGAVGVDGTASGSSTATARDREVAAGSAAAAAEYLRERAEARAAERHATVVSVDRSQVPTAVPVPPGTVELVQAHATPAMGGQHWRESMAVGDVIDAKDSEGRWFDSRIVAIDVGDRVKVHYNGWSSRWDCWFDRNDESIQPHLTHTDDWRRLKVGDALEMRSRGEKPYGTRAS